MSEQTGPIYAANAYAGFWRRTLALGIDAVLLILAWYATSWFWDWLAPAERGMRESYSSMHAVVLLGWVAYLVGFRMMEKGTPGYRIMRIRYAYVLGTKPAWTMILYRAVLAVFLLWFFALDHLWILFDERKQAWHDKVSGFYVVKRRAQPIGTRRVVQRLIQFMMLTFVVFEPVDSDEPVRAPT